MKTWRAEVLCWACLRVPHRALPCLGGSQCILVGRVKSTQEGASFFPSIVKIRQEKISYCTKLFVAVNFTLKESTNPYYSRLLARSLKYFCYSNIFLTIFSIVRFDLNLFIYHNSSQPIIGLEGTNPKELKELRPFALKLHS